MDKWDLIERDPWLKPFSEQLFRRESYIKEFEQRITGGIQLIDFANGHHYFGYQFDNNKVTFREWAPNAEKIYLTGEFSQWNDDEKFRFTANSDGIFSLELEKGLINHTDRYKLSIYWKEGNGTRIPAYAKRVVQNKESLVFDAQFWDPPEPYTWKSVRPDNRKKPLLIYEAHIGMATEQYKTGSYSDFTKNVLPYIAKLGYNTIQLMAIHEHPYYGSFGYHVSNFFAPSSRFGTPEELKELIDEAHKLGISVIMDIVHSHSVKNVDEGLALLDGSEWQYFHSGPYREHPAWDSLCFNYEKPEVVHFLLSNCKYWLEEFNFDGFRFDGVTSMIYLDHGLDKSFESYDQYFDGQQDEDAISYLSLANKLIHQYNPGAITIAEEMSGLPGLAYPCEYGGLGFDYRLSMGIPDFWIKIIKELRDEEWNCEDIIYQLTQKRVEEKTISYAESHDQALVGDKTIAFRLMDKEMYSGMLNSSQSVIIDRGVALHKMIRLLTMATAGGGYLCFMGNEFGHPEWIDFPRKGNDWSFHYARRQWSLVENKELRYIQLLDFDCDMIALLKNYNNYYNSELHIIHSNIPDQVIAFTRGELLFIFNFNPAISFPGYGIKTVQGKYKIVLNSDWSKYGGLNRVDDTIIYKTRSSNKIDSPHYLNIYIPNRTSLVMKRIASKSVI